MALRALALLAGATGATLLLVSAEPRGAAVREAERGATFEVARDVPRPASPSTPPSSAAELTEVVQRYCVLCHNDALLTGNLSLQTFDVARAPERAAIAEKMVRKLRAGMMPPPGAPRPGGDSLLALVEGLEAVLDSAAAAAPNPGSRSFQRLNRAEYQRSIRELLDLDIDAGAYLPLDTKSENFDNVADVQTLSPTLLGAYLNAAAEVSRLAVGDSTLPATDWTYTSSGFLSQWDRVEGAPFGTRGGISVLHTFPADGWYALTLTFEATTSGDGYTGQITRLEKIDVSVNGEQVALLEMDQWMDVSDPLGISMRVEPIFVRAGQQRITAAFLKQSEGPVEDLVKPHEWSLTERYTGRSGYGLTMLPHIRDLIIRGPAPATGVSETPSRRRLFSCRPGSETPERACAESIVQRLGSEAYRRPLAPAERDGLMVFYEQGAARAGFEAGVRNALQAILASPRFVFRFEPAAGAAPARGNYPIGDAALASRLSFFLWGNPPDEALRAAAQRGDLSRPGGLAREARRMLADPRAEALATRFAAQWLRLQDVDKVHPDAYWFPDFDQQLADAMRRETELFFYGLVREDRSLLELFDADYTYLNERLARHYGIGGVSGRDFRRVPYPDETRRGILGHGSILVLSSLANRTSPVLRGKWVMEVLLGTPPPPPPPGVPDLEQTEGVKDGRFLTTRQRMELHRSSPTCAACHQYMDPLGLALDNFDVTGRWRIRENGMALDTRGRMYDGSAVESPGDLRRALLARPVPLVRTFTENLLAYALGRPLQPFDGPAVRRIANAAEQGRYRLSAFVLGVVESDAFRMMRSEGDESGARN